MDQRLSYCFRLRDIEIGKLGPITKCKIHIPDNYSALNGFKSEIVGIYGQNGTGKSTALKSLNILSSLFSFWEYEENTQDMFEYYSDIQVGAKTAKLSYTFEIFTFDNNIRVGNLYYSVNVQASNSENNIYRVSQEHLRVLFEGLDPLDLFIGDRTPFQDISIIAEELSKDSDSELYQIIKSCLIEAKKVADETGKSILYRFINGLWNDLCSNDMNHGVNIDAYQFIEYLGKFDNTGCSILSLIYKFGWYVSQCIVCSNTYLFNLRNNACIDYYVPFNTTDDNGQIVYGQFRVTINDSKKTIFGKKMFSVLNENRDFYNEVKGKKRTDELLEHLKLPPDIKYHDNVVFSEYGDTPIETVYKAFEWHVGMMSSILESLFPDIQLKLEKKDEVYLYVVHADGSRITLNKESYGVRKLYMLIQDLRQVFCNPNSLLVIDEFDEGLFEYTFGELLAAIRDKAVGQLIFSAHNLRALENLDKSSIVFSSPDSKNRFITLRNVKPTNNLRDLYIRRIYLSEGGQNLYSGASSSAMAFALENLGDDYEE